MKKIVYIIIGVISLMACSGRQDSVEALNMAKVMMNKHADSALMILDSLGQFESDYSEHFNMQCRLHRLNAYNKLDTIFSSTKEAQELVDYFDDYGSSNEKMLAYYLLGRAYYDTHEAPMALNCFQVATEKADTTDENCDYYQLSRIYGQISTIYFDQNLIHQSLINSCMEEKFAWKAKDTLNAIKTIGGYIGGYKRLQQEDSVVAITKRVSALCAKYGCQTLSAGYLSGLAKIYTAHGKTLEAKRILDLYESQSGFFDEKGNIERGREIYYYTKGQYYLATHQYDSAEYLFRKELMLGKDFNNQNAASRGLALLFQQKHMGDSAAKYALYSYEMNDSVYAQMATKEVEQMQGMYDYSRNQEMAMREKERADKEHRKAYTILNVLCVLILFSTYIARVVYKKRKKEKLEYAQKLSDLAKAQIDIVRLRSIADQAAELKQLIAEKETIIAQMECDIDLYKEKLGVQKKSAESLLEESEIYQNLQKKAGKATTLTSDDWHQINMVAIDILPNFYKFISSKKMDLNDKEFETCILIRMHFSPKDVANMLGVSQPYITKIRNNMMPKLFGITGSSKELDERLMQYT